MTGRALNVAGRIAVSPTATVAAVLGACVGTLVCFVAGLGDARLQEAIPMVASGLGCAAAAVLLERMTEFSRDRRARERAFGDLEFERAKLTVQLVLLNGLGPRVSQNLVDGVGASLLRTSDRIGALSTSPRTVVAEPPDLSLDSAAQSP